MARFERTALGRCDFLDVLEETILMKTEATIELVDGTVFLDRIVDLRTEGGDDVVHFGRHSVIPVGDIAAVERGELARTYPT